MHMKNRKTLTCIILFIVAVGLFSSCAIDKKCPAYTQAPVSDTTTHTA